MRVAVSLAWRRGRDSNPRYGFPRKHAFQACDLNHSSTSPRGRIVPRCADSTVIQRRYWKRRNIRYSNCEISLSSGNESTPITE
jgi:hypothetical protein